MKKVSSVVFNPAVHEARVLKEAKSLADAGFNITVIDVQNDYAGKKMLQVLDGGIVVRSACDAMSRPILWHYLIRAGLYALAAFLLSIGVHMAGFERPYLPLPEILITLFVTAAYTASYKLLRVEYRDRRKIYRHLKKQWQPFAGGQLKAGKLWRGRKQFEAAVFELLCEEKPDIVHAHDLATLPLCAHYKKLFGAKLVFDAHEIYEEMAGTHNSPEVKQRCRQMLQQYAADVDLFITINGSIADFYASHYPMLPPALIVKNACHIAPEIEYDGRLHRQAGLEPGRLIILYQGYYHQWRGLMDLVGAAEYLRPDRSIVFMGDGYLEAKLRWAAAALAAKDPGAGERLRFVPKVKQAELPLWTQGAALGVIPYENVSLNHWFCNPNKLWEYPAAGVPLIVTPFPELSQIVTGNGIGWLLPENPGPREIADSLNRLEASDLAAAKQRCRNFIVKDNWLLYGSRLVEAYNRL